MTVFYYTKANSGIYLKDRWGYSEKVYPKSNKKVSLGVVLSFCEDECDVDRLEPYWKQEGNADTIGESNE